MAPIKSITIGALSCLAAAGAVAENYAVERTLQLSAPSYEVWNLIGDFCDIDDWHPDLRRCTLKVIDGRLHRVLATNDGAEIVEQLVATEAGLSLTYSTKTAPFPAERYVTTLSVEPIDGTQVRWSARFKSDDPTAEAAVIEMFEAGLAAIKARFETN